MIELNGDCWSHVISFLSADSDALFKLALTSKMLFQYAVVELYKRPWRQFQNLNDRRRGMLENFLLSQLFFQTPLPLNHPLRTNPAYIDVLKAFKLYTRQATIDYYSLVQEVKDIPSEASFPFSVHPYDRLLLHREIFGSKIKVARNSSFKGDLLEQSIRFYSGLQKLELNDYNRNICTEEMYKFIGSALSTHHVLYPGVLQKVNYTTYDSDRALARSDAKMMMIIHEALGGRWCMDELTLLIPREMDQDLLQLLQDVDFANQLRSVVLIQENLKLGNHWILPLREFLCRCEKLDSITFRGFFPASLVDWALDDYQYPLDTTRVRKYEWRSITLTPATRFGSPHPISSKEVEQVAKLWQIFVFGFGHCVERLLFKVEVQDHDVIGSFPTFSLPESVCLPKLRALHITYPNFGRLAYLGIDRLQKLSFEVTWLQTDIAERTEWSDWRLWKNVEELQFQVDTTDSEVDFFDICDSSFLCSSSGQKGVPDSAELPPSLLLPKLKSVTITNKTVTKLNPNILFIGPNIKNLELISPQRFSPEGIFDYHQMVMNWSSFFHQASIRPMTFPNLKVLKTEVPLMLTPDYLTRHFLGIASCGRDCGLEQKVEKEDKKELPIQKSCLFPCLEKLNLGPLVDSKCMPEVRFIGDLNETLVPNTIEHSFIAAVKKCLQQEFEELEEENRFGNGTVCSSTIHSGSGGGHDHRQLTFSQTRLFEHGPESWQWMLKNQEGKVPVHQIGFWKQHQSGIMFQCNSYVYFFHVRMV